MGTIKEQREKILAAKLKEMSDIGVNKRSNIHTPFFDPPVTTQPEPLMKEAAVSQEITETLTDEKTECLTIREEKKRPPFEIYQERFLVPRVFRQKSGFTINADTLQLLRYVLHDLAAEITLTAYIENILCEHLEEYREVLNAEAAKHRRKTTIPKK